jgi:potassium-dependent mechanosensitive channel
VMTGFGDNAVNFAAEFWVSGVNGRDRFLSDIRFLIWDALKGAGISMPFPQREVRIVGGAMPELSKEISTRQKAKVS